MNRLTVLLLASAVPLLGCDDKAPEAAPKASARPAASPKASATAKKVAPPRRKIGPASIAMSIEWKVPESWQKQTIDDSKMLRAKYTVPKADGDADDGEMGVFYFGPTLGGNKDANFKRWAVQMNTTVDEAKTSEKKVGELKLSILDIEDGTFNAGRPMGPKTKKEGYALVGVIVGTSTGNYFFKLTGPKQTVAKARPDFMKLVEGITEKKKPE